MMYVQYVELHSCTCILVLHHCGFHQYKQTVTNTVSELHLHAISLLFYLHVHVSLTRYCFFFSIPQVNDKQDNSWSYETMKWGRLKYTWFGIQVSLWMDIAWLYFCWFFSVIRDLPVTEYQEGVLQQPLFSIRLEDLWSRLYFLISGRKRKREDLSDSHHDLGARLTLVCDKVPAPGGTCYNLRLQNAVYTQKESRVDLSVYVW